MTVFETMALVTSDGDPIEPPSLFARRQQFTFHKRRERYLKSELISFGTLKLGRVVSSGHTVKLTEADYLTYFLPISGGLEVSTRTDDFSARTGQALLFGPNTRVTRVDPGADLSFDLGRTGTDEHSFICF